MKKILLFISITFLFSLCCFSQNKDTIVAGKCYNYSSSSDSLITFGNYIENKKSGDWLYLYPNGVIRKKGKFKNNKETGLWEYYTDKGVLHTKGNFKRGKMVGKWYGILGGHVDKYRNGKKISHTDY